MFSPSTPNNSIPSGSLINEGHLMRPLVGENNPSRSNPRAAFSQLNHQLPSWYTVAPVHRTSQNNVDFFGHQQLAQYQCNQPVRPLPSYQRSQITTTNTSNAGSSHLQSILGKRPAESESFFHLDGGDDMATVVRGPQCNQLPASNVQWPLPTYQSSQTSTTNTSNAGTSQLQSILGKRPAESESFFHLDGGDDMATVVRGPQCNQLPASNVQWPLPTYQSSQTSTTNTSNAGTSQLQSILGKRPAESESFFHLDGGDDMATVARGPQCSLDTDNLLSLFQSVGTPEFLATSEKVLASGRSLYEPIRAAASVAAPAHFPVTRETATQKSQACSKSTMQHRP
ncbi:hypothetical protein GUJ93_ZPchr0001g32195 [Zizania palustris]|uniref:Uncharacterized protein n=1 Tax=Zizania palustris TaxID=103762 RepID=A0A8J5V7S2_ZIZPA|nr:hypothetical protein GUJ93_ZPchr0001g32195 [Zizania palustris]